MPTKHLGVSPNCISSCLVPTMRAESSNPILHTLKEGVRNLFEQLYIVLNIGANGVLRLDPKGV